MNDRIASLRKDYLLLELHEDDSPSDPFALFSLWFDEALASAVVEPNGMTLATVSHDGLPSARIVLLKGVDHGFLFFTNYDSRKGREIHANPKASLLFWWREIERQVRIEGSLERLSDSESDAYFHSRPRLSRIAAWASPQSQTLPHRSSLEDSFALFQDKFADTDLVPRPPHWGGFRLLPSAFEFWQGRRNRMHDRLLFLPSSSGSWHKSRLAP